jgi:hypothetical protein
MDENLVQKSSWQFVMWASSSTESCSGPSPSNEEPSTTSNQLLPASETKPGTPTDSYLNGNLDGGGREPGLEALLRVEVEDKGEDRQGDEDRGGGELHDAEVAQQRDLAHEERRQEALVDVGVHAAAALEVGNHDLQGLRGLEDSG